MTRINLVPPAELSNQHLFAEFREIKMIPKALNRSLAALERREQDPQVLLDRIPKEYCLGKGHVSFFYNKGHYLVCRYRLLRKELIKRGVNFDRTAELDPDGVFNILGYNFNTGYNPSDAALALIRARIAEKIAMKPTWYRWTSTC